MLGKLRIAFRVACAPVYLLWLGYRGLWWAFDDSEWRRVDRAATNAPPGPPPAAASDSARTDAPPTDAPRHGPEQNASFEVVDSTPRPIQPPLGALRGGFAATIVVSSAAGWFVLARDPAMSPGTGWAIWGWATLLASVGSILCVRYIARRQRAQSPVTTVEHARAVGLGLKDATVAVGKGAYGVGRSVAQGCRGCYRGVKFVATSRPAKAGGGLIAGACKKAAGVFRKSPTAA